MTQLGTRKLATRLTALEAKAAPDKPVVVGFMWSSQDEEEAVRRLTEKRASAGRPVLADAEFVFISFVDSDGSKADDWEQLEGL